MRTYSSNQEFYDHIDKVVILLRSDGHEHEANKIHHLLHKVAWTTSTELFGELRNCFEAILGASPGLSAPIAADLRNFIAVINGALNKANGR
jgi:hypothetical protein